ncbi:MAG: leucyl/phenylalanyl-tRNA--protein transferase [Desulfosudaceae bacterium]
MTIFLLDAAATDFPSPRLAETDGLLAVGGDLRPERLLRAYSAGIFPWFSEGDPILWWSPDPRLILYPGELEVSRRLRRVLRQGIFEITINRAFEVVIRSCAEVTRRGEPGTWITAGMQTAYSRLHHQGWAHSVEAWQGGELVGGLYGLAMGRCFFGESMFTISSNASKAAFVYLVAWLERCGFALVDCQVPTAHLMRFGAKEISRDRFLEQLAASLPGRHEDGRSRFKEALAGLKQASGY